MSSRHVQLKTGVWMDALIRRAEVAGAFAALSHRGDPDAGSVLVRVRGRDGEALYLPERNMDGERIWRIQAGSEEALSALVDERIRFDPDLNVIEIDDRDGRHFIEEPVQTRLELQEDVAASEAAAKALFRDR